MLRVRGVYKMANGRWLVKKYGTHIGCYDTIEEANSEARAAENFRHEEKGMKCQFIAFQKI